MDAGSNFSSMSSTSTTSSSSLSTSTTKQLMSPKSPPPGLLDFYGKRKQMIKIQVSEREVGLLQEELKSLEGLPPASRCCKELDAFVGSISDPFTPTKQTISNSHHFRKQISLPWVCCSSSCLLHKKMAKGCACCSSSNSKCPGSSCLKTTTNAPNCCKVLKFLNTPCACCLTCFSCKCVVDPCSNCVENWCHACCQ